MHLSMLWSPSLSMMFPSSSCPRSSSITVVHPSVRVSSSRPFYSLDFLSYLTPIFGEPAGHSILQMAAKKSSECSVSLAVSSSLSCHLPRLWRSFLRFHFYGFPRLYYFLQWHFWLPSPWYHDLSLKIPNLYFAQKVPAPSR